jgi:hypothetical protein
MGGWEEVLLLLLPGVVQRKMAPAPAPALLSKVLRISGRIFEAQSVVVKSEESGILNRRVV